MLQIMTNNNTNLRCINLTGCKFMTDDLLKPLFLANDRLHTVDLSECHHLTDGCLQPLYAACEELKRYHHFDQININNVIIRGIISRYFFELSPSFLSG